MKLFFQDLELQLHPQVYQPAEDSFLLAEHITTGADDLVLDIGTGSGILALTAAKAAKRVVGVDVNSEAVKLARYNATLNEVSNVEFQQSDLFGEVDGRFDLILFNPPYLPTEDHQDELDKAWDGGEQGRELIDRFLAEATRYLNPAGRFLLLVSSFNDFESTEKHAQEQGLSPRYLGTKKLFFEELRVLEGRR